MTGLRALLVALAFFACAGEASAHASLVSSSPADGDALAAVPAEAVLRFDEPVTPLTVRLLNDAGEGLAVSPAPRPEGRSIRVALPSGMREGAYILSYRVISADSHPVAGSIAFSIGSKPPPVRAGTGEAANPVLDAFRIAVRALRDLALLIAMGGALFQLFVGRFPRERRKLVAAGIAAMVFSVSSVGLQGAALTGSGEFFSMESWRIAYHSTFGASAMVAVVAVLIISAAACLSQGAVRNLLLVSGTLVAAAGLPMTGHAASAHPAGLAALALAAHALGAAFWIGSLVALYALLPGKGGEALPALRRFSRIAPGAVVLLIGAGVGIAVIQLGSVSDLVSTRYGNLILAKVALLGTLIGLAVCNRYFWLPRLESAAPGAALALKRSIVAEMALIASVVVFTAVLAQTPPRTGRLVKTLNGGSHVAILSVAPGRAGHNAISVIFRDRQGRLFDPADAALEIANPGAGVESMSRPLQRVSQGAYVYHGDDLAFAGSWSLEIRARTGDFDQVVLGATIDIQ